MPLEVIRRLADLAGIALPETDEELDKLVTAPSHVTSLNEYLKSFAVVLPLLQTQEALRLATYDVARQAAEEGVLYTEIRFAPTLSQEQGLTALEVVEVVLDELTQAGEDFGIVAKALVCGMRHSVQEETLAIFKEVIGLAAKGLVGFDFAGDEENFTTHVLAETLQIVRDLGLPFTLHAGNVAVRPTLQKAWTGTSPGLGMLLP